MKRTVVVLTKKYKKFCFFCLQMTSSRKKAKSEPNPWAMESIYYYQFYCCPECDLKLALKQDFVDHAYECHLEARSYFPNIVDGSLEDVILPWDNVSASLPNKTSRNNSRKRKSQDERLSKTNSSFTKKQREGNEFEDLVKKELCSEDLEIPFSVKMDVESLDKLEPDSEGKFKCPLCVAKFTNKNKLPIKHFCIFLILRTGFEYFHPPTILQHRSNSTIIISMLKEEVVCKSACHKVLVRTIFHC